MLCDRGNAARIGGKPGSVTNYCVSERVSVLFFVVDYYSWAGLESIDRRKVG